MVMKLWRGALTGLTAVMLFAGCKKLTDEHNALLTPANGESLYQQISNTPGLSRFAAYLRQTGYDQLLSRSGNYTVFAPVDAAFASLPDPTVLTDPAKLKKLIGNHIAYQLYRTTETADTRRIAMVNGKYVNMQGARIGDATVTKADKAGANGLLQVTDKALPALDNCWEFLSTANAPVKQSAYMLSLFQKVFDTTNAVVIGVDPNTGAPVYQPGTDSVFTNLIWNKVHDLQDEKKQYTLFMLVDTAWDSEVNKYRPYFATSSPDSTTAAASWHVIRDFAVEGVYDPATVPDTVLSKFNTKVPVTRSEIVATHKTSNGIVFIMKRADVQPASKFKTITIEAENYSGTSVDRRGNTYFRDRFNPVSGADFRDVLVLGHGVALFNIRYELAEVPSIKYKAYWVAVNDFQTATHTQKLGIGIPASTTFGYTTVATNNFSEVYIGEFQMTGYQPKFNIYLTAANSTTAAVNPIVCDYIKLVPVL